MNTVEVSKQKKEIAPGIILTKYIPLDAINKDVYVFEVTVERLNIVEFQCDFTGSENINIKDTSGLKCLKTIEPFISSVVAVLELKKDWKLKSKFRFTLKSPSKEMQSKWIETENRTIRSEITNAESIFKGTEPNLMTIQEINMLVDKANTKYLDLEFIPDEISIIGKSDRTLMDSTVTQWRRPEKFLKNPFDLISRIHPNNIVGGKLDDESFISVLKCLALRPPLIQRLFLTPVQVNPKGAYRLRLCKNGLWQSVTIDDSIPCEPISIPKFTRSNENDLWPMLIEKAYAKTHRCYFSLRQLQIKDIFEDLTGCPTYVYPVEDTQQFRKTTAEHFAQNHVVCFYNVEQIKQFQDDQFTPLSRKAYSLIRLRQSLEEVTILSHTGAEQTMDFDELRQKFAFVCVCQTRNWQEIRLKGRFLMVKHAVYNHRLPVSRYYYTFDLQIQTQVVFIVHQEDINIGQNREFKPYLWISMVVFKKTPGSGLKKVGLVPFQNSREVTINLDLQVGSYILVPVTISDPQPTDKMNEQQLIYDIFSKLDLLMNRQLKYPELVPFFKAVKHPFNQQEYINLLKKYSRTKSLGEKGFIAMWKDKRSVWLPEITEFSESRQFVLSMHCPHQTSLLVKDNIGTDLDNLAHIEVINTYGREKQLSSKEAKLFILKHANNSFSYYVQNEHVSKIEVQFDCSLSSGYHFSPAGGKTIRQLDSGQRQYMMRMIPNLAGDLNFIAKENVIIRII